MIEENKNTNKMKEEKTKTQNNQYVDLHLHTNFSDGTEDPKSLVRALKFSGVDVIAITDHDIMSGYFDATEEAKEYDITLIPGVEVSTLVYHILGLNIDPKNERFQKFLLKVQGLQEQICAQRIENLQKNGVPISLDKLKQKFPQSRLGKYNVFMTMLRDDECRAYINENNPSMNISDLFQTYLGKKWIAGKIENLHYVTSKEAIDEIHKAKGIAVIAHPFKQIKRDISQKLDELVSEGIDAIEVQPNYGELNNPFIEYAKVNGIPIKYGSDYHGAGFPRKLIGRGENKIEGLQGLLNKHGGGK